MGVRVPESHPEIKVVESTNTLHIHCINEVSSLVGLAEVAEKLSKLHTEFRLVRQEGGSGYAKLHKILAFDLKRQEVGVGFRLAESGRFEAEVTMECEGLTLV